MTIDDKKNAIAFFNLLNMFGNMPIYLFLYGRDGYIIYLIISIIAFLSVLYGISWMEEN